MENPAACECPDCEAEADQEAWEGEQEAMGYEEWAAMEDEREALNEDEWFWRDAWDMMVDMTPIDVWEDW